MNDLESKVREKYPNISPDIIKRTFKNTTSGIMKSLHKPKSKYRAVRTTVDGITFASKAEARRYGELKALEKKGDITDLKLQPKFNLEVNGYPVGKYIADFSYFDRMEGKIVIEDVKGIRTPTYRLKAKLMKALYDITILETK